VPPTTAPPVTTPPVTTPPGLPAGLAGALAAEADVIRAGCADVGFIAVLASSVPGADVDVYGTDAASAVTAATALCALFEG
jgi:hypothetical protein